jgi:phage major head subunit gpT-like protein
MTSSPHQLLEQAKLDNAQIGFSTVFANRLSVAPEAIAQLAMRVPSSNAQEEMPFLGDIPMLEEWLDDRKFSKLRAEKITIRNRDYAAGIRVHRNDVMDDRLGLVMPKVMMLADRARQHVSKSLVELLLNGFDGNDFPTISDGLAYDGDFFFSTSHQDGQGPSQSNTQTEALDAAAYNGARTAMQSLQDEEGQPLEISGNTLIVGPSNERTALEIVQAGLIDQGGASGIENVFRGTANVVVSQRLVGTYAAYWFLADLAQPVRPLVWLDREAPQFVAQNRLDSESVFMQNLLRFGAQYRAGYGYGLWQFIHGSIGTT